MIGAALELQSTIRTLLAADAALVAGLGGPRVYDGAPRNQPVPFVSLDEITTRRRDGLNAPLEDHRLTIRVWSKAGGKAEALRLADRVLALVDDASLTLPTHVVVRSRLEASDARLARDRVANEISLTFAILTQPSG